MEFYVILLVFALGLMVVGVGFVNGAKFVLNGIGYIFKAIEGINQDG